VVAGKIATAVLILSVSTLLLMAILSPPLFEGLGWPMIFLFSLVAGLGYGLAYGFRGMLMSFVIAIALAVPVFTRATMSLVGGGGGSPLAGIAFVAVPIVAGASFAASLVGGLVGALIRRARRGRGPSHPGREGGGRSRP
jgi:hypothetical protein